VLYESQKEHGSEFTLYLMLTGILCELGKFAPDAAEDALI